MSQPRVKPVTPGTRPELAALEARIVHTRGQITPLYQMLLNSAPVVDGWEALLTAIRQKTSIAASLREMAILRIAILNRAPYEFDAHVVHARKAGVPDAVIDQLRQGLAPKAIDGLDAGQRDALLLVDAMTRDIHVTDAIFDPVYQTMGETGVVELVATIAAYNMVSRFLVALHIDH
jgi:4-carboxymuconolactone decarboxylase